MIELVTNNEDAKVCNSLLRKLIIEENKLTGKNEPVYSCDEWFENMKDKNGNILLVNKDEETCVINGYIFAKKVNGDSEDDIIYLIDGLYVEEDFRRSYVATHLFDEMMKMIKEKGAKSVDINVVSCNEAAISLYEKLGFEENYISLRKEIK